MFSNIKKKTKNIHKWLNTKKSNKTKNNPANACVRRWPLDDKLGFYYFCLLFIIIVEQFPFLFLKVYNFVLQIFCRLGSLLITPFYF